MNAWENGRHWPVCYRTQRDGGLPPGPLEEPGDDHSKDHLDAFAIGLGVGLLLGLGLIDIVQNLF